MSACLLLGLALLAPPALAHTRPPDAPTDKVSVEVRQGALELSWSDVEERLRGSVTPSSPRAGQPLKVHVHVGSFQGEEFDGPVTLTLREEGVTHGQTVTVRRGEANWSAEFLPEKAGPHLLDISFRTTRLKLVHARLDVAPSPIPRAIMWSVLGLLAVGAIALGIRGLLQEARPAPAAPAEAPEAEKKSSSEDPPSVTS